MATAPRPATDEEHPPWCDTTRCNAGRVGGAHLGVSRIVQDDKTKIGLWVQQPDLGSARAQIGVGWTSGLSVAGLRDLAAAAAEIADALTAIQNQDRW